MSMTMGLPSILEAGKKAEAGNKTFNSLYLSHINNSAAQFKVLLGKWMVASLPWNGLTSELIRYCTWVCTTYFDRTVKPEEYSHFTVIG